MAKKSNNELIILIVGCLAFAAFLVLSFFTVSSLEKDFAKKKSRTKDLSALQGEALISGALSKLKSPPQWSVDQAGGRDLRLFTSVPLFTKPGELNPIDLFEEGGQQVHEGIPNAWWIENEVDPSFVNSPAQDPDQDGFSNQEEFEAKTSPTGPQSFPELGNKLVVKNSSVLKWKLLFSSEIGENQYQFKYQDAKRNRYRTDYIGAGAKFFKEDPVKNRFILRSVSAEDREERGVVTNVKVATIQDAQKGVEIKIPRASRNDFVGADYTLELSLNALGKGLETFQVKENEKFNLPEGKLAGDGKYHFEKVMGDSEAIVTWLENGEKRQISLPIK